MIVGRATAEHLAAVADLDWRALHEPFVHGARIAERREALMAVWPGFLENPDARLYVLAMGEETVGFAAVRIVVGEAELDGIAVEPRVRKQGLGQRLLEHVIDDLRAAAVTRIGLEGRAGNVAARRLYAAFGFDEEGVRRSYYEDGEDAMLLGRALA